MVEGEKKDEWKKIPLSEEGCARGRGKVTLGREGGGKNEEKKKIKEKKMEREGDYYSIHNNGQKSWEENANGTMQRSKKIM